MDVGWTSVRPIVPDQHWSRVVVDAETELAGELLALQIVASRPGCEMPTRSEIVEVEL